jgi:hypothetical protein
MVIGTVPVGRTAEVPTAAMPTDPWGAAVAAGAAMKNAAPVAIVATVATATDVVKRFAGWPWRVVDTMCS